MTAARVDWIAERFKFRLAVVSRSKKARRFLVLRGASLAA